jgi:tripartite-type tricarboxylate transporter receptor subunit TctC
VIRRLLTMAAALFAVLGVMTASQTIAAALRKSMPYDPLTAFDSIGQIAAAGFVIVARSDFPADNVKDLIAAAKANPGKLSIAAPGFGATQYMAAASRRQAQQDGQRDPRRARRARAPDQSWRVGAQLDA